MEKSLLELSLDDRTTLVLVTNPLQQTPPASESTSTRGTASEMTDSATSGGMWKIFSYLNPLSYFSGSSTNINNSESGSSSWQYGKAWFITVVYTNARYLHSSENVFFEHLYAEPDPSLRNSLRQGIERRGLSSPDVDETNTSNRKKAPQGRKWGDNVHTLQHDDNDEAFKRGNAFWNGNSTQYGGDDSKK